MAAGARGVVVIVVENDHGEPCSNLDEAVSFSHSTITLAKGINPTLLAQAMDK